MKKEAEILSRVIEDWGDKSSASTLARCLFSKLHPQSIASLTPRMIKRLCPEIPIENVCKDMLYLSSDRVDMFDVIVAIFTETGELVELDSREILAYLGGEDAYNPLTGDVLERNGEEAPIVFYRGTATLVDALEEKG